MCKFSLELNSIKVLIKILLFIICGALFQALTFLLDTTVLFPIVFASFGYFGYRISILWTNDYGCKSFITLCMIMFLLTFSTAFLLYLFCMNGFESVSCERNFVILSSFPFWISISIWTLIKLLSIVSNYLNKTNHI